MSLSSKKQKAVCCKVCVDAGKEDTKHSTKNEKGKVICPTLLALLCRYCNHKGHTVSYCPVFIKNKKRELFLEKKESFENKKSKKLVKKNVSNRYQIFDNSGSDTEADADDESEDEVAIRPESPVGPPPSFPKKPTYASIVLKKEEVPVLEEKVVVVLPVSTLKKKKLWSEYTSSDDEDYY